MPINQKLCLAWAAGAIGLAILVSGKMAFLWSLGCLIIWVFSMSWLWGVLAAVVIAAVVAGPKMADPYIFEMQQAKTRALDVRRAPINLSGKTVLFMEEAYWTKAGCTAVCEAIVKFGGAKQVLFGVERSAIYYPTYPKVLSELDLYAYPPDPEGLFPIEAEPVKVTPERIDLVVTRTNSDKNITQRLTDQIGTYGLGRLQVYYDYFVFEPDLDGEIIVADQDPIFALVRMTRNKVGVPYIPWRRTGDWYTEHTYEPGSAWRFTKYDRAALKFLCGTPDRIGYQACIRVFD